MNWFRRFWYDLFKRNGWVVFRVLKFTSLENRGMGQKYQHHPHSGCCLYTHALLSFVVTEIKTCPRFAWLRTTNSQCSYQQLGQVRPVCMLTSSFGIWKYGSAHKKCEVFNILSLHMSHMVSYQDWLLPSCPESTLLFSVASENETHHTTIAVHVYSHSRETMCMLHTMQMGHLLIRQFPLTSLCRFRMSIM